MSNGARAAETTPILAIGWLQLCFAMLTSLGALLLATGIDDSAIPYLAIFFAIFGYVFVDCFRLFALPNFVAYIAIGLTVVYSTSGFLQLDGVDDRLASVAELLVLVQSVLMLQQKTKRIFEQLAVFCLLELIVAAVFNDAIAFGILLVPIGVVGGCALSLLSTVVSTHGMGASTQGMGASTQGMGASTQGMGASTQGMGAKDLPGSSVADRDIVSIRFSSNESVHEMDRTIRGGVPGILFGVIPAALLIAIVFFYALPRTTNAARAGGGANAVVGFSDQLHLEQLGPLLTSPTTVLRLSMENRRTGQPYRVIDGIYLRGRVLENYTALAENGVKGATWSAEQEFAGTSQPILPGEFVPNRRADETFYDSVSVTVTSEPSSNNSLFAVAPYHEINPLPDIRHRPEQWTMERNQSSSWIYERVTYTYGTHAFRQGTQSDLIAEASPIGGRLVGGNRDAGDGYRDCLLRFPADRIPTAKRIASEAIEKLPSDSRTGFRIARALERSLANSSDCRYTLNLNSRPIAGLDPIEQFLAVDKRGHCQYFASALVMMLRSQGIPARIVAGYRTEEFNELSQLYIARQLHAHAWVEALIERDELNLDADIYGQPKAQKYWLRLDPTPGASLAGQDPGALGQMLDYAQSLWDQYVIELDADSHVNPLIPSASGSSGKTLGQLVQWLRQNVLPGDIETTDERSTGFQKQWLLVGTTIVIASALLGLLIWFLRTQVVGRRADAVTENAADQRPSIQSYAGALRQLERLGLVREPWQTPSEFSAAIADSLAEQQQSLIADPMERLTRTFYRLRFDDGIGADSAERVSLQREAEKTLAELTGHVNRLLGSV